MQNQHNSDSTNKPRPMSRRDFLRKASLLGMAAVTVPSVVTSCSPEEIATSRPQSSSIKSSGKMTYHYNPNTGNQVSVLGYGTMHLPLIRNSVETFGVNNINQFAVNRAIDYAIYHGVNYFNTAPIFASGYCESVIGNALSRYPRDKYLISTKLSNFNPDQMTAEASKAMYHNSFRQLKVDYLDIYHLHDVGRGGMEGFNRRFVENGMLDFLIEERKKGNIRNLGFTFNGNMDVFRHVLELHDSGKVHWDAGQISLNYVDWFYPRGGRHTDTDCQYLYNELNSRNIPINISDPLMGGQLGYLSRPITRRLLQMHPDDGISTWAMRFAGSLAGVKSIVVGMVYLEHLKDNVHTCSPLRPLNDKEIELLRSCAERISRHPVVKCVACMNCMPCPYGVDIVGLFNQYNRALNDDDIILYPERDEPDYARKRRDFLAGLDSSVDKARQADRCIGCGECLDKCMIHINIPERLRHIAEYTETIRRHKI